MELFFQFFNGEIMKKFCGFSVLKTGKSENGRKLENMKKKLRGKKKEGGRW